MAERKITNLAFAKFATKRFVEDTPISSVVSAISRKSRKNAKNGHILNVNLGFSDFCRLNAI